MWNDCIIGELAIKDDSQLALTVLLITSLAMLRVNLWQAHRRWHLALLRFIGENSLNAR